MTKHIPIAFSIARRQAKRYQEGGAVELPEIKVTPTVSDEDLSTAEAQRPPREGGLLQTVPQFVGMMGSPEGRGKLGEAAWKYATELPGQIYEGVKGMVSGPGEAMAGRMTPEQQADWAAGTAMGVAGANFPLASTRPGIGVFGGRGSLLADHAKLAEAEALEKQGLNQNQIWFRTGWNRDPQTQNWFYHHDMREASINPQLPKNEEGIFEFPLAGAVPLEQVFQHPDLYRAYPFLRDWNVTGTLRDDIWGSANHQQKTIRLSPQSEERALNTLTHEVNHAIQAYEGLSQGSSISRWLPESYGKVQQEIQSKKAELSDWMQSSGLTPSLIPHPETGFKVVLRSLLDPGAMNAWEGSIVNKFHQAGKLDDIINLFKKEGKQEELRQEAMDKYIRVYGEAMSRQSELRRTMTPEESQQITIPAAMRMLEEGPISPKELIYGPEERLKYPEEEAYRISQEGFYAKADRAVDERGPNKASPEQWEAFLRNQQIKPEEDKWLGITDWLKQQRGPISKQQLQDYIQSQELKLGSYTAHGPTTHGPLPEEWGGNPANMWEEEPHEAGPAWDMDDPGAWGPEAYGENTRYSDITLPGGKNYTEFKMRWFPKEIGSAGYHTEHFPHDENLLGTARLDERNIKGKNTLHIHELQSDWHQEGAREGYREAAPDLFAVTDPSGVTWGGAFATREEAQEVLARVDPQGGFRISRVPAVKNWRSPPDAPFKKNWDEMLLKRTLRYAVEKGFDQVSWPATVETVKATQKWPELEAKEGKYLLPRGVEVTPIVRRYTKELPDIATKLGKRYGAHVDKAETSGYPVFTLPLTPAFKKAIMEEGFPQFKKGGKVKPANKIPTFRRGGSVKDAMTIVRRSYSCPS